jgi:cobalt/nickel transport system permease protein
MKHSFIDQYSRGRSIVHKLDPSLKFITMLAAVVIILSTPPDAYRSFVVYGLILFALTLVAGVPFTFFAKRLLSVFPFVVLLTVCIPFVKDGEVAGSVSLLGRRIQVTHDGLVLFWNVLIKAALSMWCMLILSATTRFEKLLKGLARIKCPGIIIMVLSFMYRYAFLFSDELMRLGRAKQARSYGMKWRNEIKTLSTMIGVLFVRSYERAERVYLAMCSRGFDGTIPDGSATGIGLRDILFAAAVGVCFAAGRYAGF